MWLLYRDMSLCQMMATRGYSIEGTAATHKDMADLFKAAFGLHLEQLGMRSAVRWVVDTFAPLMDALVTFEKEYVLFLSIAAV